MTKKRRQAYDAINEVSQGKRGAVTTLLKSIGVSRQAYYKALHRQETEWECRNRQLQERVKYWFKFNRKGVGAGTILSHLHNDDHLVYATLKMVKRVMKELNLCSHVRKKKYNRVQQNEQYVQDNVLDRNFDVSAPYQVWLSDSTELVYGVHGEHKVRLSGVLDLYGRRLLAYNLTPTETSAAEIEVFQKAFDAAGDVHPMIHTDRGSAYTSYAFNHFLEQFDITRSMSRPGTPYDNAPMERWWNEFKLRWMEGHPLAKTYEELVKLVEDGIYYFNHFARTLQRNGLTTDEYWSEAA